MANHPFQKLSATVFPFFIYLRILSLRNKITNGTKEAFSSQGTSMTLTWHCLQYIANGRTPGWHSAITYFKKFTRQKCTLNL
jgi:hypothetical protein